MATHARSNRITFTRSFVLKGLDGRHPPGTYSLETREKRPGFLWFLPGKRSSTWIQICRNWGIDGVLQMVNIDPLDLAAALKRDAVPAASAQNSISTDAVPIDLPYKKANIAGGAGAGKI
jgi:hypothetical protein